MQRSRSYINTLQLFPNHFSLLSKTITPGKTSIKMKLTLLFVIVLFVGTALAKDVRHQTPADARVASIRHSRAQAVKRTCLACQSKREYSDDNITLILECVGKGIRSITSSVTETSSGNGVVEWSDVCVGIVLQCAFEVFHTHNEQGSTEPNPPEQHSNSSEQHSNSSEEHSNPSEQHSNSSEQHPNSSEEHNSSQEKPHSKPEDDDSKKRHKSKRQKSRKSRSHHARAAHKGKVL